MFLGFIVFVLIPKLFKKFLFSLWTPVVSTANRYQSPDFKLELVIEVVLDALLLWVLV